MAKSKYHLQAKSKGKRKQFPSGGNPKWLRTRHRVRKNLLR